MNDYLVEILSEFLGEPRKHNESRGQISFDCPVCAEAKGLYGETDGKGNLEVNYNRGFYKCWACYTTHDTQGVIKNLIYKYGSRDNLKQYNLVKPDYHYNSDDEEVREVRTESLPDGFKKLIPRNEYANGYKASMSYLAKRGVTQKIIDKYNIGFINEGPYSNRVVIPSYHESGDVNYFIARSILYWIKPKYMNSRTPKDDIIFNHSLINPNATIYLVEGPFDSIVVPNCIPLLGLFVSDTLFQYLQSKAKANVVIILDGEAKKEADQVFKLLNTLKLYGRVKIIYLKEKFDMSLIYQKYGDKGLKAVLTKETRLKEIDY